MFKMLLTFENMCFLHFPLWETVWRFLKKLKIKLSHDPAILLLRHIPGQNSNSKRYTPMFTAALLTMARKWKQFKCPSTDVWINKKMWYIYTMEYYSAIKNKIMPFAAT